MLLTLFLQLDHRLAKLPLCEHTASHCGQLPPCCTPVLWSFPVEAHLSWQLPPARDGSGETRSVHENQLSPGPSLSSWSRSHSSHGLGVSGFWERDMAASPIVLRMRIYASSARVYTRYARARALGIYNWYCSITASNCRGLKAQKITTTFFQWCGHTSGWLWSCVSS